MLFNVYRRPSDRQSLVEGRQEPGAECSNDGREVEEAEIVIQDETQMAAQSDNCEPKREDAVSEKQGDCNQSIFYTLSIVKVTQYDNK